MRPAAASAADVNRLQRASEANDRRLRQGLERLSAAQAKAVRELTQSNIKSSRHLAANVTKGDNALSARITKETADRKEALIKQRKSLAAITKRAERRQMWNTVLVGTSSPLWAMYGDRSSLTAPRNLKLFASNVAWFCSDEIFGAFMGKKRAATMNLAWLAVAGNIGTMLYLANNEQHQRYLSIVKTLPAATGTVSATSIDLTASDIGVASEHIADFEAFSEVRTTATYLEVDPAATTVVLSTKWLNKKLTITGQPNTKVAIVVDTWKNNGDL